MAGRLEVNFKRLLGHCETMAGEESYLNGAQSWRMEQYLSTLQDQLSQLNKKPGSLGNEDLTAYQMKVNVLKGLVQAEKLKSTPEKILAVDRLPRPMITPPGQPSFSTAGRQAQMKAQTRHLHGMRSELMSSEHSTGSAEINRDSAAAPGAGGVRYRGAESITQQEMEETVRRHREKQEQIAEEMVGIARHLKESHLAAKSLIQRDVTVLSEAEDRTVSNQEKLKSETEHLQEHTRQRCAFWTWFIILFVVIVFLSMVVFIRIVPKPRV